MVPLAVAADLAVATAGLLIASPLRYGWDDLARAAATPAGIGLATLGILLWVGVMSALATYRPAQLVSTTDQLTRVLLGALVAWFGVHFFAFFLKVGIPFESRLVMGISLPVTLLGAALVRLGVIRPLALRGFPRLSRGPVLFVGEGASVRRLARAFEESEARKRRIDVRDPAGFTPLLAQWVVRNRRYGEVVIVATPDHASEALEAGFASLDAGAEVTIAWCGSDELGSRSLSPREGLSFRLRNLQGNRVEAFMKRLLDLAGASAAILLLSPALLAIAIVVKLSSRGPVLYAQERVGRRGRRFHMYKFRTMQDGNDPSRYHDFARAFIREGRHAGVARDGSKIYKPPKDPRVTPVGVRLRRFSLDELPQLWNVLRGEMSLVGPRPCLPCEWKLYAPWQRRRLDAIPGCTGLWQVRGRSRVCFEEMVLLDLQYAHQGTLCTDLRLIAETIPVMLLGRGAY